MLPQNISSSEHQRHFPNNESPKITENKGPTLILSDSMLPGIKPMRTSCEHYINKLCISGGKINEITEAVRNMDETTPYRKVLIHVGTNNIMLLLTNCEVHTGKYSDRSLDARTERSEFRTKN